MHNKGGQPPLTGEGYTYRILDLSSTLHIHKIKTRRNTKEKFQKPVFLK